MKYMGSKNRIAKYILPIILKNRKPGQYYVEPFVGGANMIDKVDGLRIGADLNEYLIFFWRALLKGWTPPEQITLEEYTGIKENKEVDLKLTLWAGICCSYGGKWFGGFVSDYKENRRLKNGRLPNHQTESRNSVLRQVPLLQGVDFRHSSYQDLDIPPQSIIYCDPPYRGTTGYKDGFDNDAFWEWCRFKSLEGHSVFISEYSAPEDFLCILNIEVSSQLSNGSKEGGNKTSTEKLFIYCDI